MTDHDREYELARLCSTIEEIQRQLMVAMDKSAGSRVELQNHLSDYWDSYGGNMWDEAQLIEAVERQRSITAVIHKNEQHLQKALSSPYFGRIDFIENWSGDPAPEKIYIGITTLTDSQTDELLVYDWRAPVSGMFYDFERGEAWYQAPIGPVSGTITLKRQYKIVEGQMKYMFDSDLKIDDEILQEILSKSADDKMHTIVTSIQREQNQVIRNEENKLLLVSGPAGSGKTSIALHRIAYLLYRERETLNARNILIFSPNHIFSDYISNVLPEMGEENVLQTTFQDYITSFKDLLPLTIESRSEQLEYVLAQSDTQEFAIRVASIAYKTSAAFEQVIQNYIQFYQERLILNYPEIRFGSHVLFQKSEWAGYYLNELSFLPPLRRLAKIREIINLRIRPITHELRRQKEAEITASAEEVNEKTIKALARVAARQELSSVIAEIDRLTRLNSLALYRRLFEDKALYSQLAREGAIPKEWPAICKQTRFWLNTGKLSNEDSFAFLYFQGMLEGFPVKNNIKYVVIDEAQDYTVLQYRILANIFPNCSWTILGDPAQLVHPYIRPIKFQDLNQIIPNSNPKFITLSRSYRSTKEIQAFCNALLPDKTPSEYVNRQGKLPQVVQLNRTDPAFFLEAIQQLQQDGCRSIAIICKTVRQSIQLHEKLQSANIHLLIQEDAEFQKGILIMPAFLAKGLEFDGVLVYDVSQENYQAKAEKNLLYTVCSRALHRLILCYQTSPSPFITALDPNLYLSLNTTFSGSESSGGSLCKKHYNR